MMILVVVILSFVSHTLLYMVKLFSDICTCHRNKLRWFGHVKRKDKEDWVRECMYMEVGVQGQKGAKEDKVGNG